MKAEELDEEKEETREARGSDVHKVGFWGLLSRHIFDMSTRGRQATACQADGITKDLQPSKFVRKESAGLI